MTIKKTDLPELIVIILFCVYVALSVLSSTALARIVSIGSILRIINIFNLFLLIVNLINLKSISLNRLVILVIFLLLGFLVAISSQKETEIIVPLLFILNGIFLKDSKIIRCYIIVVSFICCLTILLNILGIYSNDALIENRGIRYFLGFNYTTFASNFFLHLYIAFIAIKKKPITVLETITVLIINSVLFYLTDTKAPYFLIYLAVFSLWVLRFYKNIFEFNIFRLATYLSMPVLSFSMVLIAIIYKPSYYFDKLDKILAGRLSLGNKGFKEYGFSLFGKFTQWETGRKGIERSGDYFFVDSSYLNIMLTFGIVTLAFVVIAFMILSITAYDVKNYYLCIAIILLAIHAFTDPQLFELRYNPLLLFLGPTLFGSIKPIIHPDNW